MDIKNVITLFVDLRRIDGKLFYFPKNSDKRYMRIGHSSLLLKTCYRTSANLSDGSVWSNPPTDSCLSMDVSTQIPH
ncbi:hypothetical protein NQ317_003905 [Molorchus minor]|uniref:Uncharacterized protein n=1 Tax=Molorchus minor TaxID=1323400 RepID=A0ABQ9J904_9CUCU|nr:hypothetical protein NQ317_003905 [Molorchus minor]